MQLKTKITREQIECWIETGYWPNHVFPETVLELFCEAEKLLNIVGKDRNEGYIRVLNRS